MRPWRVPYPKFGKGPGLERVTAIAGRLGLELARFGERGAAIVGSNGKGSTAAMTAALLQQAGERVGLFTSPHLFDLNERFRIGGEDISDEDLERHWGRVADAVLLAGMGEEIGGFEFLFLVAADWFAAQKCERTVWEAGIGGRLDPVRLVQARRLALTSLDLEHTELLGATLEEIARDKLDAAPSGATVFVGRNCVSCKGAIAAHCAARGVTAVFVENGCLHDTPLPGTHQRENAALAVALVRDLLQGVLSDEIVASGLAATKWPGRLEVLESEPLVVIDVGHTPAAVTAALAGFEVLRGGSPGVLVCGVSHDKSVEAIVAPLASAFQIVICAAARHKGAPATVIAQHALGANPAAEILIADTVAEARAAALARARALGGAVYVAGSLFLAAEFKAVQMGRDPATLAFF